MNRPIPLAALIALTILAAPDSQSSGTAAGAPGAKGPAPSHLEAVAFDVARGRLVLFGGSRRPGDTAWVESDETWEWDGDRWHAIPARSGGPGPRRGHALGYDPADRRVVLVGGLRSRTGAAGDEAFDETWTYDGRHWTPGPAAPFMSGHQLVHSSGERALMLLGFAGREAYVPRRLAMWRRTPNGWAFVDSSGPVLRGAVRAAFDSRRAVLVVPVLDDSVSRVWEWNGRVWRRIDAPGPTKRSRHTLAYDSRTNRVVLIGGRDDTTREPLGDQWAWDGERWHAMASGSESPGLRASASLVADPDSGRLLLYGGVVPVRGIVADLWTRSHAGWTRWSPSQQGAQQATTPAFTSARGAFIGLSVVDLEASVRWYTEKLGLKVVMRPPKIEKSTAVILEGGGLIVELMHHEDAVALRQAAPAITRNYLVHGVFKAGLIVDDFDKTIENLRARGVQIAIGPFPATAEQRANAIIRDNAGNFIQFFGAR